jgi:hypothetical protein
MKESEKKMKGKKDVYLLIYINTHLVT